MPTQKEIWQREHLEQVTFTRIHTDKPSGPVPSFAELLAARGLSDVLDIGCGNGRNSVYLAGSWNFRVIGIDFVPEAIAKARAKTGNLTNLGFEEVDLSEKWPFTNNQFDAVIDCNSTICIPNPGRTTAINEAFRVLKPEGYYLFYGVGPTQLTTLHPGPEPNSGIFPDSGKFEKEYTKEELLKAYGNFDLINLEEVPGKDIIQGREILYSMWVAVFRKPQ